MTDPPTAVAAPSWPGEPLPGLDELLAGLRLLPQGDWLQAVRADQAARWRASQGIPVETGRQAFWRRWVHEPLTERELAALRRSVTSGRSYGSESWVKGMGLRLGVPLAPKRRGRPPKAQAPKGLGNKMNGH
jgi:hypothetical protein